jgi:hypothetical protein
MHVHFYSTPIILFKINHLLFITYTYKNISIFLFLDKKKKKKKKREGGRFGSELNRSSTFFQKNNNNNRKKHKDVCNDFR